MNRKRKYEIVVCLIALATGAVMVGLNVSKLSNAGNVALYSVGLAMVCLSLVRLGMRKRR